MSLTVDDKGYAVFGRGFDTPGSTRTSYMGPQGFDGN